MFGSTVCGFVLAYFDHQTVILLGLLTMSISIFFVPLCTNLWILYATMMINGLSSGFLVNAGNCFIIHQWGKENSPFMQMAHFSFGFGAFLSPFIAEPFLREVKDFDKLQVSPASLTVERLSNSTVNTSHSTDLDVHKTPLIVDPSTLKLKWTYFIVGVFSLFFWILFVITYLNKRDNKPHPTREVKAKNLNENFVEIMKIDDQTDKKANPNIATILNVEKIRPYHKYVLVLLAGRFPVSRD